MQGLWGNLPVSRNQTAVLSIVNKGHLLDPCIAAPYAILRNLFDSWERLPDLVPRLNAVRLAYGNTQRPPLGPVGIALRHGLPAAGLIWDGERGRIQNEGGECWQMLSAGERNHELREAIRKRVWRKLAEDRPSFAGVEHGIDTEGTNTLRLSGAPSDLKKAVTCVLTGGVFVSSRWHARTATPKDGDESDSSTTDTSSEPSQLSDSSSETSSDDAPAELPNQDVCRFCTSGAADTVQHMWWECAAYDHIRSDGRYREVVLADKNTWPACLRNWGVLPKDCKANVEVLQHLYGSILLQRWTQERGICLQPTKIPFPWRIAIGQPAQKHTFLYDDAIVSQDVDAQLLRALFAWLAKLEWTNSGQVSNLELAVDFELWSGLSVSPRSPAPLKERGKLLFRLLVRAKGLAETGNFGPLLPARRVRRTYCLSSVGGTRGVWGAWSARPHFAGGETTMKTLETELPKSLNGAIRAWGKNHFPAYDLCPARRIRAMRWSQDQQAYCEPVPAPALTPEPTPKPAPGRARTPAPTRSTPLLVPTPVPLPDHTRELVCEPRPAIAPTPARKPAAVVNSPTPLPLVCAFVPTNASKSSRIIAKSCLPILAGSGTVGGRTEEVPAHG